MTRLNQLQIWIASTAIICLLASPAKAAPATGDLAFTVNVDSFEYPFANAKDNQAALAWMLSHASIVGHYYRPGMHIEAPNCGRGSRCTLLPHLEESETDHPVKAHVDAVVTGDGMSWRLEFKLPEKNSSAELALVTLIVPLDGLWQQPSVLKAIEKASISLPDYEIYKDAQKKGNTVAIDLIAPDAANRPGPYLYYCPVINNPMSWTHSGVMHMQVFVQTASGKFRSEGGDLLRRSASDGQCMHPSMKPGKDEFYRSEHE